MNNIFNHISKYLTRDLLNEIRYYLSFVRDLDFKMSESLQENIAKDFVQMKQMSLKTNTSVTADDLHALINLSR